MNEQVTRQAQELFAPQMTHAFPRTFKRSRGSVAKTRDAIEIQHGRKDNAKCWRRHGCAQSGARTLARKCCRTRPPILKLHRRAQDCTRGTLPEAARCRPTLSSSTMPLQRHN